MKYPIYLDLSHVLYYFPITKVRWPSLVAQMVKILPEMQETQVRSLVQEIPWRRKWQHTPVFLPGESMGSGAWQATAHGVTKEMAPLSS